MQHTDHGVFVDAHDPGVFQSGRGRRSNSLSGEAGFPKKATLLQNRDDGFFALLRDHGQLDLARLDIEHGLRRIPLRKENLFFGGVRLVLPLPTLVRNVWGWNGGVRLRSIVVLIKRNG